MQEGSDVLDTTTAVIGKMLFVVLLVLGLNLYLVVEFIFPFASIPPVLIGLALDGF